MTLTPRILAVTKIQAFLASCLHNLFPILLCTFPPGSSSHCFPPTPRHSAFWSRCSSSHNVPYPSWPSLKPGTVPRTLLLWEGLLILPHPLPFPSSVSRLEGKICCSPSFSMFFPKHSFSSLKHSISPLRTQQSCSTHSIPFSLPFVNFFFWILTHRLGHMFQSPLC